MNRIQTIIVVSLLSTALLSWLVSAIKQDEIMNGMMIPQIYNPMLISLFTASWTGGMAVMMFPAIVPMILLYSRLIENKQTASNNTFSTATYSTYNILHFLKILIFVSMYLNVWTTTGIGLILGCSVSVGNVPRI
jgi:predicted metal-binding membrane protein